MKVLVADDEKVVRAMFQRQLEDAHQVFTASSSQEATKILAQEVIDLAFIDLHLDEEISEPTGVKLIEETHKASPATTIIAMTGIEDPNLIDQCFILGASDYVFKPILPKNVPLIFRKGQVVSKLLRENRTFKAGGGNVRKTENKYLFTTKSPKFQSTLDRASKLKGTNQSVLIRGESGSGKEMLAEYLWHIEGDTSRAFIPIDCGAIPSTLAESEFFGHKKGSFSDAKENRIGKFEAADGGDIFLDEVATLPLDIQVKLLRVLNDGEITVLGQNQPKKVNCRVIAATNEPLEEYIKAKTFREDIFFRLKQISITLPPLRERKEDISDLVQKFLKDIGSNKPFSPEALDFCIQYRWPGNIRELRDTVKAAAIFADGNEINLRDLRSQLESDGWDSSTLTTSATPSFDEGSLQGNFNKLSREFEQGLVKYALKKGGSDTGAARYLGLARSTLRSKMKLWGWNC